MRYKGFTLAEVLITLGVIGVVAAITMPSLIANYQKHVTVNRLKKEYTTLAQAFAYSVGENGEPQTWDVENLDSYEFAKKYFYPYLKIVKDCGMETTGDCAFTHSMINSDEQTPYPSSYVRFYLNDGTRIALRLFNQDNSVWSNIYIDINGNKKPNKYGKDIFMFSISFKSPNSGIIGRLRPSGKDTREENISDSQYGCSMTATFNAGSYCAALIMGDGWQIKDDYPW